MPTANLAGSTYTIPAAGSRNWSTLTNYLVALSTDCIQRNGGSFTLLAELSFAGSYGLKVPYLKSTGSNLAAAGVIRLANAESVAWRNAANGADKALKVNASDLLEFDGVAVPTISSSSILTNKSIDADTNTITNIENADIKAAAAIDATKIADGSVTNTEFQYISTLSSNVQTQITDHLADTSTHGVAGAILGTTDTQNVSNKTFIDAITLTEIATPASPSAGTEKIYTKSDGNLYKLNSAGVETRVGSGSGQGEKNYITNPSGEVATTGWGNVGDLDIARTTTAGDLPRENTTPTGLKITADGNTQSVADYVYFDFTLDDVDLNKKIGLRWAQKVTGTYTAGQLAVGITTQADRTTFLHTPVVTAIPANDQDFVTEFDSGSTATLSLVIRATGDMTQDGGIVISDVVVGPGHLSQTSAVAAQSVTFTGSWVANTTYTAVETRVGRWAFYQVKVAVTGAPTGTTLVLTLPTGRTIDTSLLSNTETTSFMPGSTVNIRDVGSANYIGGVTYTSTTTVTVLSSDDAAAAVTTSNGVTATSPMTFASGDYVQVSFWAPIAEWASSTSALVQDNLSDWQSWTPTGSWSANVTYTGRWRRVGANMEIDATVACSGVPTTASLIFNIPTGYTIDTAALTSTANNLSSLNGCGIINDSTTNPYRCFPTYGTSTSNFRVSYQSAVTGAITVVTQGDPFAFGNGDSVHIQVSIPITQFRNAGSSLVGFSRATSTSQGLVGGSNGIALTSGQIGEVQYLSGSQGSITENSTIFNIIGPITLTPGVWMVSATALMSGSSGTVTQAEIAIDNANNAFSGATAIPNTTTGEVAAVGHAGSPTGLNLSGTTISITPYPVYVPVGSTVALYLNGRITSTVANITALGWMTALRVA
jgi:hypothetical protein